MYTLGTSSIDRIAKTITDTTLQQQVKDALIAYVGTATERENDAAVFLRSVFFERTPIDAPTATLWIPAPVNSLNPNTWTQTDITIPSALTQYYLQPAGDYAHGLYAFQRGEAKNGVVPATAIKYPGLPFWDMHNSILYVCGNDNVYHKAQAAVNEQSIPVGSWLSYPDTAIVIPANYLRCAPLEKIGDAYYGRRFVVTAYPLLAQVLLEPGAEKKYRYNHYNNPEVQGQPNDPLTEFRLPGLTDTIIRYQ